MSVATDLPPPVPVRRGLGCLGWSLILGFVCLLLCGGGVFWGVRWLTNAFSVDPARVRAITSGIADFDPPESLEPKFGFDLNFGVAKIQAAFFMSEEGLPMAMLMQFAGMSEADAHRQLEDAGGQMKNFIPRATTEQRVTVRGAESTAVVQTGVLRADDDDGPEHRLPAVKASAAFTGRGGAATVIVIVSGDDEDAIAEAVGLVERVR